LIEKALMINSNLPEIDLTAIDDEPQTWEDAKKSVDAKKWEEGYKEELRLLKEMGVYKVVPRSQVPPGTKIWKGQPVFKIKRDEKGNAVQWKVQLVFKGFEQIYGKDYSKTTSPMAHMESWRILLNLAASKGYDAQQVDIKTAYLYSILLDDEVQYMEQPPRFKEPGLQIACGC